MFVAGSYKHMYETKKHIIRFPCLQCADITSL